MLFRMFFLLAAIIPLVAGEVDADTPDCAVHCWENTKYVSKCLGNTACLCREPPYQNYVFQCLYSQCDTAHFGSALHYIVSHCLGFSNEIFLAVAPIPNRESLHRREDNYAAGGRLYGSGSALAYPTESGKFPLQSSVYPTQSAESPYTPRTSSALQPYFPLNTAFQPTISQNIESTTSTPAYNIAPTSVFDTLPQLYTGRGPRTARFFFEAIYVTVLALYLAL